MQAFDIMARCLFDSPTRSPHYVQDITLETSPAEMLFGTSFGIPCFFFDIINNSEVNAPFQFPATPRSKIQQLFKIDIDSSSKSVRYHLLSQIRRLSGRQSSLSDSYYTDNCSPADSTPKRS